MGLKYGPHFDGTSNQSVTHPGCEPGFQLLIWRTPAGAPISMAPPRGNPPNISRKLNPSVETSSTHVVKSFEYHLIMYFGFNMGLLPELVEEKYAD